MKKRQPEKLRRIVGTGVVDYLPDPLVAVIVHTAKYSIQAYLDERGIWRSQFTNEPINGKVLSWEKI